MTRSAAAQWPTKRLGELADFRNGINYTKDSFGAGMKVVGVSNFQDYTTPHYDALDQIDPTGIVTERNLLRDGDIVFVRSNGNRDLIGRSLLIDRPPCELTHSGFTIRVRFTTENICHRFYAYLFRTRLIRAALTAHGGGTNIANLNQDILANLEVPLPSLGVQSQLAAVLAAYDDLIDNNQRRIRGLEEMARALYREWFVHFRFPGHEGVQRVSSPLGELPEGWLATTLGSQLTALETGRRPKGGVGDCVEGVPSIGAENIDGIGRHKFGTEKFVPREFFVQMRLGVVRDRDVAIYKDGAYIGKSSYFRDRFPHEECCVNEHVFLLRTSGARFTQNALYLWLQEPETVHALRATNANAAQPGLNQKSVLGIDLVVPDAALAARFDRTVEPLLAQLVGLATTSENLRRTRDLLLPRLLAGRVSLAVSEAES